MRKQFDNMSIKQDRSKFYLSYYLLEPLPSEVMGFRGPGMSSFLWSRLNQIQKRLLITVTSEPLLHQLHVPWQQMGIVACSLAYIAPSGTMKASQ